jgi:hypothetical protein
MSVATNFLIHGAVFAVLIVIDLAVFVDLCCEELRDWRAKRQPRGGQFSDGGLSTETARSR